MSLKYGFVFPVIDVRLIADLAAEAESAGWDAVFVADSVWGTDPWVTLTAIAMRTTRLRFGPMITPVSRYRPWQLAAQTATLDHLSGGRLILSVGLGALDTGFPEFDEVTDRKARAELLDEGLDIITGLWKGQPFSYDGKHYHLKPTTFFPPPSIGQTPRIPIWVVGAWPHEKSLARALRYDGLLPAVQDSEGHFIQVTPDHIREMVAHSRTHRTDPVPLDIVMEGRTSGDPAEAAATHATVNSYAEAGATWWLEAMWMEPNSREDVAKRIRQGPPLIG